VTAAFAKRQAQRGFIKSETAKVITNALIWLHEQGGNRETARKMLGFAKWIYEALRYIPPEKRAQFVRVKTLDEFLKLLSSPTPGAQ
jgi:hypothetical protein